MLSFTDNSIKYYKYSLYPVRQLFFLKIKARSIEDSSLYSVTTLIQPINPHGSEDMHTGNFLQ